MFYSNYRFFIYRFFILGFFTLATACGPNQKLAIKGVDLNTSEVSGETYINMEAIVVLGNLKFPNLDVPVTNPNTHQPLGQMSLQHLEDGTNRIYLSIDFEAASKLPGDLGKSLPNGREIPLALGLKDQVLAGIPVLEKSRIYVGGDSKKDLFIGAAVAVPAFDSVMSGISTPLNLFYTYPFSPEVSGTGGLFTGPKTGENGVAIFVKRTNPNSPLQFEASHTLAFTPLPADASKLNRLTLFRMNRLLKKNAVMKVK